MRPWLYSFLAAWLVSMVVFIGLGVAVMTLFSRFVPPERPPHEQLGPAGDTCCGVVLIYASPLLAALTASGYVDFRRRKERVAAARRRQGRCSACGYDLRGTSGAKCPECGAERDVTTDDSAARRDRGAGH